MSSRRQTSPSAKICRLRNSMTAMAWSSGIMLPGAVNCITTASRSTDLLRDGFHALRSWNLCSLPVFISRNTAVAMTTARPVLPFLRATASARELATSTPVHRLRISEMLAIRDDLLATSCRLVKDAHSRSSR